MKKCRFAVLTDSASDIPFDLAQQYGVEILNFKITVDGKSYVEREDFTFEEYYDILRTCECFPSTSQVTMNEFFDAFCRCDDEGCGDVLYVSISSTGSATHDSAVLAKTRFQETRPDSKMNIYIIDSRSYSLGYGWYVVEAARKLQNGAEMSVIVEWLVDIFSRVEIMLAAYSLKFMKKSGRISAAAAFAGELLGFRPLIRMVDGATELVKKVRGDRAVLPEMTEYIAAHIGEEREYIIVGTHDDNIAEFAAMCEKCLKEKPLGQFKLGAAVATNTGPDAIAAVFLGAPHAAHAPD